PSVCSRAPPLPRRQTVQWSRAPPAAVPDLSLRGERTPLLLLACVTAWASAGGNQRELARQRNAKKQTEHSKGKRNDDGLSAAARKQRDAEIMQQKQKKANEKSENKPK
uniref:Small EDRK-rich factor 2a n=1 Tax=Scleropages formosus TaxID=113540 RepID=A0A8C9SFZ9_SCLFO